MATLRGLGVEQVFVSVHPFSQPGSRSFSTLENNDFCIHEAAKNSTITWHGFGLPTCKTGSGSEMRLAASCLYDSSNPAAREYVWSMFKASYFDKNITNFWTDGTEPGGDAHRSTTQPYTRALESTGGVLDRTAVMRGHRDKQSVFPRAGTALLLSPGVLTC